MEYLSIKIAMKAIKNIPVIHTLRNFWVRTPRPRLYVAKIQQGFVKRLPLKKH